ncbi:MAG: molybdopterin-dependent oxidoreductase, partial [Candidatus Aminicenantes bacterium]|nr:molybdopterin-dependent oxidoreductase [Candidatus Aminicenantes bacterium]
LLTPERVPNRRGAVELGFETNPLDMERLKEETDLLIVFGTYFLDVNSRSELEAVFESVEQSILFTPNPHELNEMFDMVLPFSFIADSEGSLTNVDGLIQPFQKAMEPEGESRAVWRILRDLGQALNIRFPYYKALDSVEAVRTELGKEISFFRK